MAVFLDDQRTRFAATEFDQVAVWVDHEAREVMSGLPDRARLTLTCHQLILRLECLKVFEGGRLLVWRGGVD